MDGNVFLDVVGDLDDHRVAFSRVQSWPRESAVHRDDGLGGAEPGEVLSHHLRGSDEVEAGYPYINVDYTFDSLIDYGPTCACMSIR